MAHRTAFKKEHMKYLLQFQTDELKSYLTEEAGECLEKEGRTLTAMINNEPVLCGGIKKWWDGRGELWGIFKGRDFYTPGVHRMLKYFVDHADVKRLEMVVYDKNTFGHKLAKVLGFKVETKVMEAYRPDGGNATMYVRIF